MKINKFNKLAVIIILTGIAFTTASFVQYRMLYPDVDKLLAYCGIGILTVAVGVLFHCNSKRFDEHEKLRKMFDYFEEKVQDFVKGGKK